MIRCKCFDFIPPFVRPLIRSSVVVGGDIACLRGGKGAAGQPASRCSVASSYFCCLVFPPSRVHLAAGERNECAVLPFLLPPTERRTQLNSALSSARRRLSSPSSSSSSSSNICPAPFCFSLPPSLPSFLPLFCHGPVTNEALLLRPQKHKLQLETSNSQNEG